MKDKPVTISIITPLYKGLRFLLPLQKMLKECVRYSGKSMKVEWIVSNDFPNDIIELPEVIDGIKVTVLNTSDNLGIQGARVRGLEASSGEFVLFLDQDDTIEPNWIQSQITHIGDADGVVCDCQFDGVPFYNGWDRPSLEECITKEYNINEKNGFVPGQVLIRRSSIPATWTDNLLKWNACDDQLLWLCMFGQGAVFVPNKDTCYHHRRSGNNQSRNLPERYLSNREMVNLIEEKQILHKEDICALSRSRDEETIHYLKQNVAQKQKIEMYEKLLKCFEASDTDWFDRAVELQQGIAIYGISLGTHLYRLLERVGIPVECFIDRNKADNGIAIPIVDKNSIPENVKTVINTLIMDMDETDKFISEKYPDINIVHIHQLLKV